MVSQQLLLRDFYMRNSTLGSTERQRNATIAETYYLGRQYDALKEWNDKSVPLNERKPLIQIPLFADAVHSLDRFVWGGHRFPKASIGATRTKDDAEDSDDIGPRLDIDQAKDLTRYTMALIKAGRLHRAIREVTIKALQTTSAALILGTMGGYLIAHGEQGKHCTPTWDPLRPRTVAELEILYRYRREEPNGTGGLRRREYWYRRVVDAEADTVFVEVPVIPGKQPEWVIDKSKTVEHRLGFCPVVWLRTLPDSSDAIDGRPVIDPQLYPLIDDVNRIISQRSRAVGYGCDPQVVRTGVPEGQRDVLMKSPGTPWDLPKDSEATLLEAAGSGAERATEHLKDMTARFREAVGIVKADADGAIGNISGVVLEFLHAPMIALAATLREDLGGDGFCALINLALRMATVLTERGEDVWIQGTAAAAKLMRKAQLDGVWLDFPVTLNWEPFFAPTVQDELVAVQSANQAVQGGLITKATATKALAEVFNIEDVDAELEAIETERAEAADYGPMMQQRPGAPAGGASPPGEPDGDEAKQPKPTDRAPGKP